METTNLCVPDWPDRYRDPLLQPMLTLGPAEVNSEAIEGSLCYSAEVVSRGCRSEEVRDLRVGRAFIDKKSSILLRFVRPARLVPEAVSP